MQSTQTVGTSDSPAAPQLTAVKSGMASRKKRRGCTLALQLTRPARLHRCLAAVFANRHDLCIGTTALPNANSTRASATIQYMTVLHATKVNSRSSCVRKPPKRAELYSNNGTNADMTHYGQSNSAIVFNPIFCHLTHPFSTQFKSSAFH